MENSEPGTSTSNRLGGEHQVFLSFRGPDTRHGFTDFLHRAMINAGIHVFIDDEELRPGEKISGNLERAIDHSKLYIPIFSKNYASSHWCLRELARMVENTSKSKEDEKFILPIFYDVKPDDVKLETELYNKAISNLEQSTEGQKKKFSSEDIEKWRQALQKVGGTDGWEPKKDSSYTELIGAVVEEVVVRLKTRERQVTKYLVGMEDQIAAVNNLLDINSERVQLIGIYGTCGIGKTTLAKIIFNQLCPRFRKNCSFLEDVRKTAKGESKGLKKLQEQLLCDISYSGVACKILDIDDGMDMIGETICNNKTLIVLDDVDEAYQIQKLIGEKSLYPGTRILVTTTDKSVLNIRGFKYKFKDYEMVQLSDRDAIKLFSRHAFNGDSPPNNFYTLSRRIVSTAGGLPLALKAIGSSLFEKKNTEIWEEMLEKLKETPHTDIYEKLLISYEALEWNEQEIFLDIACFFVGENKTNPMYMWKACKLFPESAIKVLINKCMIKELDDNSLWMHNQFKDFGRTIAKEKGTRLWDEDNIIRELRSTETKGSVQALCLKPSKDPINVTLKDHIIVPSKDPIIVTPKQIERFPNIRFLSLDGVSFQGDFTSCLSKLKWTRLDYSYFIPPRPATVRRISLDYLRFEPTVFWHLENMVVLNLSGLDMTEDVFQGLIKGRRKLKVLTLCYNTLVHGTPTFSQNSGLEKLTISSFFSLKKIGRSIGRLTKLIDLSFEFCVELEKLPEQIGGLLKLQHLSLRSCDSLRELPDSVLKLTSLKKLDLWGTRITRLPDSIDRLSSLLSVNVSFTPIEKLPSTMSKLLCLRTLYLKNCDQIQELPALPKSLTTLQLTSTSLVTVPNLSYLTNLVELALSDGSERVAKSDIIQTCDLQWIGSLSGLSKLQLCFSNVCVSTIELCSLSLLKELTLHGVDMPAFEQLPSSKLKVLELYDTRGKKIQLPPSEKQTAIVASSSRKSEESKVLRQIGVQSVQEYGCSEGSVHLREEPGCNELQAPELIDHWRGDFHFPSSLNMLQKFVLWGCPGVQDIQFVSDLESLLVFSVGGCTSLKRLSGLSNLKFLMDLTLKRCWSLQVVEGINELEFLCCLEIDRCGSVERILDPVNSKIPAKCLILITRSGDLPDCGQTDDTWKSYREKIFHGSKQQSGSEIEIMDSEIETEHPLKKTSMEKMKDEAYAIAAVQAAVGIDDGVQQITDLLEMEVNDEVCIIGIYGTDGIGKTTLAKAVYNRISSCFDSCSFLAEVEATLQNPSDIQFFQTKLIRDILERDREDPSFDERIEDFLDIFREMKVLIVIDDVEKQSYLHAIVGDLHWFGLGSRIIVTSQNEEILKEYDPEKARTYMVGKLDDNQAFELFYQHAFGKKSLTPDHDGHVNCIVNATEKLPLAIEVTGSFLRGKPIGEWEKMEESIKKFMSSSGKTTVCFAEISDICYKGLDPKQKHIFLDIACFVSGVDARVASYMWSSSYPPSPDCILMPLAKIGENNELQMHSLLRCVGRRILDQKVSEDPIQRKSGMAPKAKSGVKGKENVEARRIDLDDHDSCKFTAGDFESIPDKTFLKLDNAKVFGDYAGAFPSLKWLCWQSCPSDFGEENFVLRELVILDLSGSKVTEDWRGWSQIKMEKLKVLNLMGCSDILITPNFSGYKDLEILILERCSRLVKLDPSIGHLKRLVSLNLKSCSQLNKLPVELGHMTALEELFIDGTSVRKIPISIGNLKKLKFLSGLKCFQLSHLPSSVSCLIALSVLSLDGTKISDLPSSLGELLSLRRLSLRDCHYMQELPDSIGKVGSSLEELDISATSISTLPNSIKNLQNLRVLRMDSSFVRAFPVEIGNLTKLEELHASWCRSLQGGIPRDIKRLYHLRSLTLGHSSISSLPSEISTISSLHTLDLLQCNEIVVLPKLPPSLICLRVSSKRMKAIPCLKDLKELEELYLSDEDPQESRPPSKQLMPESKVKQLSIWFSRLWNLEFLQTHWTEKQSFSISFPKLRKLELSLSRIIKLHIVYEPTDIPQLKTLTLSGMSLEQVSELPKTLSVLSIRGCSSLKRLPIVQSLTNISAFELYHSAIEEIEGLEGLKSLKRLDISNCKIQNLNGIVQLTSLRSLIVSDCDYLHSLPDLSNLKLLKVLEIRQCKMIHQIEGLEELTSLEKLKISECPAENSVQVQNVLKLVKARSLVT